MTNPEGYKEEVKTNVDSGTPLEGIVSNEPKNGVLDERFILFFNRMQEKLQDKDKKIEAKMQKYKSELKELRTDIELHKFTCIVGDDKSSRVPTLELGQTINEIYSSRGEERVPILFIDPHNYTGSRGGDRGVGEESEERNKILKTKVRDLFEKAGIKDGTMLLITDWVATGSTVDTFQDIAKEVGLNIKVVTGMADVGDIRGGLIQNKDLLSIHAKPRFIEINNKEDVIKQLDIIKNNGSFRDSGFNLKMVILEAKIEVDRDFPINSEVIRHILSGSNISSDDLFSFIKNDLSFEQQKTILNLFRKWTMVEPREDLMELAKELSKWFSSKEGKMSDYELYLEERERRMSGGM